MNWSRRIFYFWKQFQNSCEVIRFDTSLNIFASFPLPKRFPLRTFPFGETGSNHQYQTSSCYLRQRLYHTEGGLCKCIVNNLLFATSRGILVSLYLANTSEHLTNKALITLTKRNKFCPKNSVPIGETYLYHLNIGHHSIHFFSRGLSDIECFH